MPVQSLQGSKKNQGQATGKSPFVPSQTRDDKEEAESQKELTKSARVTAFIAEGGDFPTSQLFAAARPDD
jgi:hypothetical protein